MKNIILTIVLCVFGVGCENLMGPIESNILESWECLDDNSIYASEDSCNSCCETECVEREE